VRGFYDDGLARDLGGLSPRAWACVGAGFAREDLKAGLLARGIAFSGEAVLAPQELALRILRAGGVSAEGTLGGPARQEILRALLADPRIGRHLAELRRLRRQTSFFRRLDRAIQAGRAAFAHAEEGEAQHERLAQAGTRSPVREEVRALARVFDAWLEDRGLWDPPRLLGEAARRLRERGWPEGLRRPERIDWFRAELPEGREQAFWDAVGERVEVRAIGPLKGAPFLFVSHTRHSSEGAGNDACATQKGTEPLLGPFWGWERWHTLDDAAEALAESFARLGPAKWGEQAVLIPDTPSVRRTLARTLASRGIPLADPRDPTRLRWEEGIKWALAPLEAVAGGYERDAVLGWLRQHLFHPELPRWTREIAERGIRQGLGAYAGGKLSAVHSRLGELEAALGGKRGADEFAAAHLGLLRAEAGEREELQWIAPFLEGEWAALAADLARAGFGGRKAPALYWLERLRLRLEEASPPVERHRPAAGVRIYRLSQAPLVEYRRLWLFGLPPDWLAGEGTGDYWYSAREREQLAAEFAVRSGMREREERIAVLDAWLSGAREALVLDAAYDWDGRERESLAPVLADLGLAAADHRPSEPGAHPRWVASHGSSRAAPPREIVLPRHPRAEIQASEVEAYSRCSFLALASKRWRLEDAREAQTELWPDVQGNILHAAVRILLESLQPDGAFARTAREALEEAWALVRPRGLLRGRRLEEYAKRKCVAILEAFVEKESAYRRQSGARVRSLEGPDLRLEYGDFAVVGVPDRIDETDDGLFIQDYKTSASLPYGSDMLERGYRLQLPFYAIAAERQLGRPAIGVQFIHLGRKGDRNKGLLFSRFNGKDAGKLTNLRANNKSLVSVDPSEAWARIGEQLKARAEGYACGRFEVRPVMPKDCERCHAQDLCGQRRTGLAAAGGTGEGESDGD
jgi:RecB family exonuclease